MPIYYRKSFTIGPLRINISKSGIGASFGEGPVRIGKSANGRKYVTGRGPLGFFFRKYFR